MSLLSLSGVRKHYGDAGQDFEVLSGLDFDMYAGEFVGIWGSDGAGRTTLARIAAGLEAPSAGTVEYIGEDLARLALEERIGVWRRGIAWVGGEGPADEEVGVCEYVAESLLDREERSQAYERASEVLRNWGLDDVVDQRWVDLSDFNRALAEIVRAILRLPNLLVLDGVTARVRFDECESVMDLLRSYAEDRFLGVLLMTPNMADLLHVHRFAWLSDGQLIEPRPGGPLATRLPAVPFRLEAEDCDADDEEDDLSR